MATIRLQTNVPVIGTVQYIDWYAAKPNPRNANQMVGPDLGLKGVWNAGPGTVYLPAQVLGELVQQGMVTLQGYGPAGEPVGLQWAYPGPVQVLKAEQPGSNRKLTTVTPSASAPPPAAAPPPARPAAVPAPGVPVPQLPLPTAASLEQSTRTYWAEQYKLMRFALEQAYAVHADVAPESAQDHDVVASTAHSFYIQANRDHMSGRLPRPRATATSPAAATTPPPPAPPARAPDDPRAIAERVQAPPSRATRPRAMATTAAGPGAPGGQHALDEIPESLEEANDDDLPF